MSKGTEPLTEINTDRPSKQWEEEFAKAVLAPIFIPFVDALIKRSLIEIAVAREKEQQKCETKNQK